jgi:hypothetical protein
VAWSWVLYSDPVSRVCQVHALAVVRVTDEVGGDKTGSTTRGRMNRGQVITKQNCLVGKREGYIYRVPSIITSYITGPLEEDSKHEVRPYNVGI